MTLSPHYDDSRTAVYLADCRAVIAGLPDNSVDSVVTDPPYELAFMGKAWDNSGIAYDVDLWRDVLRVLKPGGHLLSFGGSRTFHRMAVAIEDAGFEIRDSIAWLYGSGFPKSLDVSKAIDAAAGATREVVGSKRTRLPGGTTFAQDEWSKSAREMGDVAVTAPATDAAKAWSGWGTALKPAFEPVVVARKPLEKGKTVAGNVLAHGTGALNIDGSRIGSETRTNGGMSSLGVMHDDAWVSDPTVSATVTGRWPANVILDEGQAAALDEQTGILKSGANPTRRGSDKFRNAYGDFPGQAEIEPNRGADAGGASRFFYVAKAPKSERPNIDGVQHATVKPLTLMRYLVKLVTPPDGVILEPFAGSGTTVEAAILEGFRVIAIDAEPTHWPLIRHRIARGEGV